MEVAKIEVSGILARTVFNMGIPAGIVGASLSLEYKDPVWENLNKTVVFRGCQTKDILNAGESVVIPAEVVVKNGVHILVGVYGTDASGQIVIPTIWTSLGVTKSAADPSGDTSTNPTLPVWAQIREMVGDLDALDTEAKENLVAAVNEAARGAVKDSDVVLLATGKAIAKDTDLDTVTTFGNYKCTSSATVKTLLKCPVDTAFIMRVGSPAPGVADYFYQEIITLTGVRYYRYGQPSSGVLKWNNWRKTFDTNGIIPARYGGMGANISSDLGEAAHMDSVQKFVEKMNETAVKIGMTSTMFKTPSGLNRKPVNANKAAVSSEYNSHTTAYDVLRLMVAVKHTPNVLTAMGSARCDYFKNGGAYYASHSCLGNSNWNAWAEENGYIILAAKGGSLSGEYGEIGANGILNFAFLIQSGSDVYAVSVVGLNNDEFDVLRTIVHDLISGEMNSAAISEANSREYPVGMAVAKLTDGCFDDDIAALANGTYYNEHAVRVTASIAKIMTALVATHYMGNYDCSVNYDDLVGGGTAVSFAVGDKISTTDALSLMMAVSDNAMATMLARVCGEQIQVAENGNVDLRGYATERYVQEYAQPKGNYLTQHQDLSGYAKKSEIPTVPTNVSAFTNDAGYLTKHQDLSGYAKKDEIPSDAHINGLIDTKLEDFDVPSGGGGSGGGTTKQMRLIHSVDIASGEGVPKMTITKDAEGNSFSLQQLAIVVSNVTTTNYTSVAFSNDQWKSIIKVWPKVTNGSFVIEIERLGNRVTRACCITGGNTLMLYNLKTDYSKDYPSITGIIVTNTNATANDGANVSIYGC